MNGPVLGIDVSKHSLDFVLLQDSKRKHRKFPNNAQGFHRLAAWLEREGMAEIHACLEATGAHGDAVAKFLYDGGWKVYVANPRFIKHFAIGTRARTKTDRYDAGVIAEYCQRMELTLWRPPSPELLEMRQCVRELQVLIKNRAKEKNRLQTPGLGETVERVIRTHIDHLNQAIKDLKHDIQTHVKKHPELQNSVELLISIPGIGEGTAWQLVAELGNCSQFNDARQLAAFLGLTPMARQSGSSLNAPSRLSKIGSRRLRRALYYPALAAKKHNPAIHAFADRLKARGNAPKSVICACMRKLAHIVFAILRSGKPFNPQFTPNAP